jgi:hypothetical protein
MSPSKVSNGAEAEEIQTSTPMDAATNEATRLAGKETQHLSPQIPFSEIGLGKHVRPPSSSSLVRDAKPSLLSLRTQKKTADQENVEIFPLAAEVGDQSHKGRRLRIVQRTISNIKNGSPTSQDLNVSLSPGNKSLRNWMPSQLRGEWGRPNKHQARNQGRQPEEALLRSVANRTACPVASKSIQVQSNPDLNLPPLQSQGGKSEKVKMEMDLLKRDIAGLQIPSRQALRGRDPEPADQEWFDSTVQEIAKCGSQNTESRANTTTITTTGSNHLEVNPKQKPVAVHIQDIQATEAIAREEWMSMGSAASGESMNTDTFESLPRTYSSTSPSLRSETTAEGADTILVRQPQTNKDRAAGPVGRGTTFKQEPSTPTTSTPLMQPTFISTLPKTSVRDVDITQLIPAIYPRTGAMKYQAGKLKMNKPIRTSLTIALHRKARTSKEINSQQILRTRVPGGYPEEEGEDVVTADLFRSILRKLRGETVPMAMFESARLLCVVICRLARMYWVMMQPMLDAKSEFWKRHAKHELTWTDGLRTLLAVPGAVLAIAMFA